MEDAFPNTVATTRRGMLLPVFSVTPDSTYWTVVFATRRIVFPSTRLTGPVCNAKPPRLTGFH